MKFHHIGVATNSIEDTKNIYISMGFVAEDTIHDENQNVNLCFLRKELHPDIELIEPIDEKSPVFNILRKIGVSPYHICYSTNKFDEDIKTLKQSKFIIVVKPIGAKAFSNRRICFCYNQNIGLIELVEE